MTTLREAAQQALKALEYYRSGEDYQPTPASAAITALRAALAEPGELRENERLREALHRISLASQNSMSSKDECGRIARAALQEQPR